MMTGAYLDHAATTPMRPEALSAMTDVLSGPDFGNPSGSHRWARQGRRLLDDARDQVAGVLGAAPGEVVFTSGGTEAANLAVLGAAAASTGGGGGGAVCSAVEHHAVLRAVERLEAGQVVPVDGDALVDLDALAGLLARAVERGQPVAVVSVMLANNETGAVNDLDAVAAVVARESPTTRLHTDAVAAAAWIDLSTATARADLVSISAHKFGGPKGIGVLVVRDGAALRPLMVGGGQERERRSGTANVGGAVALAAALEATANSRAEAVVRVEALRERLRGGLVEAIPDIHLTSPSDPARRTPQTLHVCLPGIDREALLFLLDEAGIAASWGSSCASGASEPSHVLAAMGVAPDLARGALRLSLGWCSTGADVDVAVECIPAVVSRLRAGATR